MDKELIFDPLTISKTVGALAAKINNVYPRDIKLTTLCVMNASTVFHSDLIRSLTYPKIKSYFLTPEEITLDDHPYIFEDTFLLIIDTICDTGRTFARIQSAIEGANPFSIRTCCLLDKVAARTNGFQPDYVGLTCPFEFVIGYGLDHEGIYRNLPSIYALKD